MKEWQNYITIFAILNKIMDLGKGHQWLLMSQKERQLDIMISPGESIQYHSWEVLAKETEPKSDQIPGSNYKFYGVGGRARRMFK